MSDRLIGDRELAKTREAERAQSDKIVCDEQVALGQNERWTTRRTERPRRDGGDRAWGIALSGGGIRSSTFCTGILQALAGENRLKYFDYLSTVSGGGFIGSSLRWWWHGAHGIKDADGNRVEFGTEPNNFPYGTWDPREPELAREVADKDAAIAEAQRANLEFLRNHGYYLTPGNGITIWSGIAVVVRSMLLNLLVWIPLAILLFYLLWWVKADWPILNLVMPHIPSPLPESLIPARWGVLADGSVQDMLQAELKQALVHEENRQMMANVLSLPPVFGIFIWLSYALLLFFLAGSLAYSIQTSRTVGAGDAQLNRGHYRWGLVAILFLLVAIGLSFVNSSEFLIRFLCGCSDPKGVEDWAEWWGSSIWCIWIYAFVVGFVVFGAAILARIVIVKFRDGLHPDLHRISQVYVLRRYFEKKVSRWFKPMLALLIFGFVPVIFVLAYKLSGSPGFTGVFSLMAGMLAAVSTQAQTFGAGQRSAVMKVLIPVGAGLFLFGLVVVGYQLAMLLVEANILVVQLTEGTITISLVPPGSPYSAVVKRFEELGFEDLGGTATFVLRLVILSLVVLAVFMSTQVNTNQISLNRFYRDRLMEAYMPNAEAIRSGEAVHTEADGLWLSHLLHQHDPADEDPEPKPQTKWSIAGDLIKSMITGPWTAKTQEQIEAQEAGNAKGPPDYVGPYPLINTNIILVNDDDPKVRLRGGDNYLLSPLYCGSTSTDWSEMKDQDSPCKQVTLATAMATSGAAANPNAGYVGTGVTMGKLVSIVMMLLNIRLGYWVVSPKISGFSKFITELFATNHPRPNHLVPGALYSVTNRGYHRKSPIFELSDGGHFDNSAMYELIRRRCSVIVACDGEADKDYGFAGFVALQRRVAEDFGVQIIYPDFTEPQTGPLTSTGSGEPRRFLPKDTIPTRRLAYPHGEAALFAKRPFFVAEIIYPMTAENEQQPQGKAKKAAGAGKAGKADGIQAEDRRERGRLIYIKSTMIEDLSFSARGYKAKHPDFPHETTADQFFDPQQFEVYRELGYYAAKLMMDEIDQNWEPRDTRKERMRDFGIMGVEAGAESTGDGGLAAED